MKITGPVASRPNDRELRVFYGLSVSHRSPTGGWDPVVRHGEVVHRIMFGLLRQQHRPEAWRVSHPILMREQGTGSYSVPATNLQPIHERPGEPGTSGANAVSHAGANTGANTGANAGANGQDAARTSPHPNTAALPHPPASGAERGAARSPVTLICSLGR